MELYVRSGEPHHRDLAAGGVHQHYSGLQQQSAALHERLHGLVGSAAAGCWILRRHGDGNHREQQGRWVCPESERGAVRGPPVPVCGCLGTGLFGRPPHVDCVADRQSLQEDKGVETEATHSRKRCNRAAATLTHVFAGAAARGLLFGNSCWCTTGSTRRVQQGSHSLVDEFSPTGNSQQETGAYSVYRIHKEQPAADDSECK